MKAKKKVLKNKNTKEKPTLMSYFLSCQCTEVHFVSFFSRGFITAIYSTKSNGKETVKTHLCAVCNWDLFLYGKKDEF